MKTPYILTLDAGTTGVKCAAFTREGTALSSHVAAYPTRYPAPGWAQQEPEEVLAASLRAIGDSFQKIIVVRERIVPWYDENGVYTVGVEDFLLGKTGLI